MSEISIDEIKDGLPVAFDRLHGVYKGNTSVEISSVYGAVGHIWINNKLVEVQLVLEKDPNNWFEQDFAEEMTSE